MSRRKKEVKIIDDVRKTKILRWLNEQAERPTYEKWDETTLMTLNGWSEKPKFGDKINFCAQSLYLQYLKEVCIRQCIRKYGKEIGEEMISKKKEELRGLDEFCEDARFHADNL